jgi:hypothetical protein
LGGVPPGEIEFKKSGAYQYEKKKGIYGLKIFLFRNQYNLNKNEYN